MKLVKEYLFEKFEEETDPIQDMGIGINNIFPEICKSILNKDHYHLFFDVIYYKNEVTRPHLVLRTRSFYGRMINSTEAKFLQPIALKKYVEEIVYDKLRLHGLIEKVVVFGKYEYKSEGVTKIPEVILLLDKNINIKYKKVVVSYRGNRGVLDTEIFEKFIENSDPIRDLGIGHLAQLTKKYGEKVSLEYLLIACSRDKDFESIDFLLDIPEIDVTKENNLAFRWLCHTNNTKLAKKIY